MMSRLVSHSLSTIRVLCLVLVCGFSLAGDGDVVRITLLQLNDVYEMTPVGGQGGLARVATLEKQLKAENPATFTLLAGDLVSPSAIGLAKINGQRIAGQQMIESVNPFLNVMTFGNHEFDIKEDQLRSRIAESRFTWVSSNVFDKDGKPWPNVKENLILGVKQGKHTVRIGIFGLTLDSAHKDFVSYKTNYSAIAREQVDKLKQQGADIIIGLTHLDFMTDTALAQMIPEIDLIMGGHEHENMQILRGNDFTPITKADANARTVYIHKLEFDTATRKLETRSHVQVIDDRFEDEPATAAIVNKWVSAANQAFIADGMDPSEVVTTTPVALDGRESKVRNTETKLTEIIASGMQNAMEGAVASFYNSGSIRIDDVVPAGQTLTEYDVLRILPFGGNVVMITIKGSLLSKVLDQGVANKGSGGWLQKWNISGRTGKWKVGGKAIDPGAEYKVVTTAFLLTGQESGLDYLKPPNPDFTVGETGDDIRQVLIKELRRQFPPR